MTTAIQKIREALKDTIYENHVYLVGGIVRDRIMGRPAKDDVDMVLEGDSSALACFLHEIKLAQHTPVLYPRFGTSMVTVDGVQIEIVGARKESYSTDSRKPDTEPATLKDDVFRRDFTINTLLENLNTGEVLDLTELGMSDITNGIIRTPLDPVQTFTDDPLRMMRAVRFAARFGFEIESNTLDGIHKSCERLKIISAERIRDEFVKTIIEPNALYALDILRTTGLLKEFLSELADCYGVTQNGYHTHDVWMHSLLTLEYLPVESGLSLRLAALLHDIGKPSVRSVDEKGFIHFYGHQLVSAEMVENILKRLKFSNAETEGITYLVLMHMRLGEYSEKWSDSAVRRLIRDTGDRFDDLLTLVKADIKATGQIDQGVDLDALKDRIRSLDAVENRNYESPLNGNEIMQITGLEPGIVLGKLKDYLSSEVIEGHIPSGNKEAAKAAAIEWIKKYNI